MKKIFYLVMLATIFAVGCSNDGDGDVQRKRYLCNFEDDRHAGGDTENPGTVQYSWWKDLVDTQQYGGELLYSGKGYAWYDVRTDLYSKLPDKWQTGTFDGGGIAISNYIVTSLEATYEQQLTISEKSLNGAANTNFAVCYVASNDVPPFIEFKYTTGIIEFIYVVNTSYTLNVVKNGNSFAPKMGDDQYIKIVATGIDKNGNVTNSLSYKLFDGPYPKSWKRWDLSALGVVKRVEFRMYEGRYINGIETDSEAEYPTYPMYFAFDNIQVLR
ncbi:MAG: DUF4465 domain-containing protein [Alistipes sp.]|nr:DUF4465 domain-containing protein [Alistipes sp.]